MQPLISSTATKPLLSSCPDHVSRVVTKDSSDEECVQVSSGRAYLTQTCQKSPMTSSLEILALDLVGVEKVMEKILNDVLCCCIKLCCQTRFSLILWTPNLPLLRLLTGQSRKSRRYLRPNPIPSRISGFSEAYPKHWSLKQLQIVTSYCAEGELKRAS